jgi:hypothetical protein
MKQALLIGLAAASLTALAAPSPALAGDEDDARVAIAAAKAKLDGAEKAGVGGNAGDVLSRSRTPWKRRMSSSRRTRIVPPRRWPMRPRRSRTLPPPPPSYAGSRPNATRSRSRTDRRRSSKVRRIRHEQVDA